MGAREDNRLLSSPETTKEVDLFYDAFNVCWCFWLKESPD